LFIIKTKSAYFTFLFFSTIETREITENKSSNHEIIERADKATQTDLGIGDLSGSTPTQPQAKQTRVYAEFPEEEEESWDREEGDKNAGEKFFGDQNSKDLNQHPNAN